MPRKIHWGRFQETSSPSARPSRRRRCRRSAGPPRLSAPQLLLHVPLLAGFTSSLTRFLGWSTFGWICRCCSWSWRSWRSTSPCSCLRSTRCRCSSTRTGEVAAPRTTDGVEGGGGKIGAARVAPPPHPGISGLDQSLSLPLVSHSVCVYGTAVFLPRHDKTQRKSKKQKSNIKLPERTFTVILLCASSHRTVQQKYGNCSKPTYGPSKQEIY